MGARLGDRVIYNGKIYKVNRFGHTAIPERAYIRDSSGNELLIKKSDLQLADHRRSYGRRRPPRTVAQ